MAAATGRSRRFTTFLKLLLALGVTGVLAAGVFVPAVLGSGLVARHYANRWLDTTCTLQETKPPQPTVVYARDNKTVLARIFKQDRQLITLNDVPQALQDALIATEDRRFYSHHGVDMRGLLRSAVSTSGGDTQGGSTLTMQYVKQIRYYQAGDNLKLQNAAIAQTIQRKMEDAKCALDIEGARHESKRQILTNYLNIAFFGENAYGVQVAAKTYFDKPVSQLTLGESALLVGVLRAPTDYNPFLHLAAAKQRRDEVLQNLVAVGKLSQAEADRQKALPVILGTSRAPVVRQGCENADTTIPNAAFFCSYAINWLETVDKISEKTLQTGGLRIVTTIDPAVQKSTQAHIVKSVPASSPMTAVLPVVDPKTGDVLAMASNKSYGTDPRTQTEQPIFTKYVANGASTFKLFPLLTALSVGVPSDWKLKTVGSTGDYTTSNCLTKSKSSNGDAKIAYDALESLASATAKSSNTYYVALADKLFNCDLQPTVDLMQRLGMNGLNQPSYAAHQTWAQNIVSRQAAQQLVLGYVPTNPLELTGAYAAVANHGTYNTPAPILSVTSPTGSALEVRRTPGVQAVYPQVADRAVKILEGDTHTSGSAASEFQKWYSTNSSLIAGKTGTNDAGPKNNSSIWFAGITKNYAATLGLIDFDQPSLPSSGLPTQKRGQAYGDYAAKVWVAAMTPTLQSQHWTWEDSSNAIGENVPDIEGAMPDEARATLAAKGFKMAVFGGDQQLCPSSAALGTVGYYAPTVAPRGATITVCQSSERAQYVPYVPKPVTATPAKTKKKPTTGSSSTTTKKKKTKKKKKPTN